MVTWAAAQESRRWCFHKRSNFETRPQPGRRGGNNKFVWGQSSTGEKNNDLGEKKNHSWAGRECVGRHLEENGSSNPLAFYEGLLNIPNESVFIRPESDHL